MLASAERGKPLGRPKLRAGGSGVGSRRRGSEVALIVGRFSKSRATADSSRVSKRCNLMGLGRAPTTAEDRRPYSMSSATFVRWKAGFTPVICVF